MAHSEAQAELSDFPKNMQHAVDQEMEFDFGHDLVEYLKDYAREKPEVAALWCFGIGFILGWKLKPW